MTGFRYLLYDSYLLVQNLALYIAYPLVLKNIMHHRGIKKLPKKQHTSIYSKTLITNDVINLVYVIFSNGNVWLIKEKLIHEKCCST